MNTNMKNTLTVRLIGSEMGPFGWVEGKTLDVIEGFRSRKAAEQAGRSAMRRLAVSGVTAPHKFVIDHGY